MIKRLDLTTVSSHHLQIGVYCKGLFGFGGDNFSNFHKPRVFSSIVHSFNKTTFTKPI